MGEGVTYIENFMVDGIGVNLLIINNHNQNHVKLKYRYTATLIVTINSEGKVNYIKNRYSDGFADWVFLSYKQKTNNIQTLINKL